MALRILASFVLLFSILFLPFWVSLILVFGGIVYFSIYLEAIFLLLLLDFLYGVKETHFLNITFISFIVGTLLLVTLEILKKKLRLRSK